MHKRSPFVAALLASSLLLSASAGARGAAPAYDVVIRGGTLYDGSGAAPVVGDIALNGDRIGAVSATSARA